MNDNICYAVCSTADKAMVKSNDALMRFAATKTAKVVIVFLVVYDIYKFINHGLISTIFTLVFAAIVFGMGFLSRRVVMYCLKHHTSVDPKS